MKISILDSFYRILHPKVTAIIVSKGTRNVNLMACSWITPVSEEPPLVAVAISKDSYTAELIRETREFTINIASTDIINDVWTVGTKTGRKVDKTKLVTLSLVQARKVYTPAIAESLGTLECRVRDTIEAGECFVFIAEVLEAYVDERAFALRDMTWGQNSKVLMHLGSMLFTTPSQVVKPTPKQKSSA